MHFSLTRTKFECSSWTGWVQFHKQGCDTERVGEESEPERICYARFGGSRECGNRHAGREVDHRERDLQEPPRGHSGGSEGSDNGIFQVDGDGSLFGTKEKIVEYDFTAGSEAEAERARKLLEEKRKAAESGKHGD